MSPTSPNESHGPTGTRRGVPPVPGPLGLGLGTTTGTEAPQLPADVAALLRAGFLEEVEPGVFRRPRMPSRAEVAARNDEPSPSEEMP